MRVLASFVILSFTKIFAVLFYKFDLRWLSEEKEKWNEIRYIVFLNHTSLFEPLFVGVAPFSFIARLSRKMVAPGADKTLNRPIVGLFYRLLSPGMISISRKRDKTWRSFMETIEEDSVIVIAPEGRMKRANGLDLNGNPMTVKGGVADILSQIDSGKMLIAYSGGLHHVQIPGQKWFKVFKTLKLNAEILDIQEYKSSFDSEGIKWKRDVVNDMQRRLESNCPA